MKRWGHQGDQQGRDRSARDRARLRARPGVESLEGRALLSTIHALTTSHSQRDQKQPAAFKPPVNAKLKFPPYDITLRVNQDSDPVGSGNLFQADALVDGYAPPFSTIWLAQGLKPGYFTNVARADGTGHYAFLAPVGFGTTVLQAFAENPLQDYSRIETVTVTRGNAIVAWDSIALRAIQNQNLSSPEAARDLAILHSAQYDAVAAVDFPKSAYRVHVTAPKGASAEAAADSAASTVLTALFPSQAQSFTLAYNAAVAGLPKTPSITSGLALGREVANQTLAGRANDGSSAAVGLAPSLVPGLWRPTPPTFSAAQDAQFGQVTPFEIASGSSFRPAAPPKVGTPTYDQALAQVASLGRLDGGTRTADQTAAAFFWADGAGSFTNPGHWNQIAEQISVSRKDSLAKDARLFARLDFALADAAIASSDAQYTYDEWRPVTAVQQTDPSFSPLLVTPASPSYVSESAAYGSAAAEVLNAGFGSKVKFTDRLDVGLGMTRTFSSFNAAATENANSRVWGGVNFSYDAQAGINLGSQVGSFVLAKFPK